MTPPAYSRPNPCPYVSPQGQACRGSLWWDSLLDCWTCTLGGDRHTLAVTVTYTDAHSAVVSLESDQRDVL